MTVKIAKAQMRMRLDRYTEFKPHEFGLMGFKYLNKLRTKKNEASYFCSSFFISKVLLREIYRQFRQGQCRRVRVGHLLRFSILRCESALHGFIFKDHVFLKCLISRLSQEGADE